MERVSTGIKALDQILGGGLPAGSTVLITGCPGSGKTIMAHQIMFNNASPENKIIYLTTLAEPLVKVMRFQKEFSYFDPDKFQKSVIYYDLGSIMRRQGAAQALLMIDDLLKKHEPGMLIIDTIKTFSDITPGISDFREFILDLSLRLAAWNCTTLLLGEYSEDDIEIRPESAIADGIICLYGNEEKKYQKRHLRVLKMRGTAHTSGETVFKITSDGLEIFPRLNPVINDQIYDQLNERILTGVAGLDDLMGGGIQRGTTTLVSGPAGTGNTFLALCFALTGLSSGEKVVFVSFEENAEQIMHNAINIGLDLRPYIQADRLHFLHVSPIELDVDEHIYQIQTMVNDSGAKRLIIDSISAFEIGMSDKIKYTDYIWALTDFFKTQGVSVLLTHEMLHYNTEALLTKHGISYVADNLILLQYQENGLDLKRCLRVVKMRSSCHSTETRELLISRDGLRLKTIPQANRE